MMFAGNTAGRPARKRPFFEDDGGFSTVGMVLAMLLTLALIFTSAQVGRVQSASADIQNVADAAALAAENQVASFYIVANICDAVVLSMSLTGICVAALGVACMCVPLAAGLSVELEGAAAKIFQARNSFAQKATKGLNQLQKMLPFIACAQAYSIASANSGKEGSYLGCAVLLPFQGAEISIPEAEGTEEAMADIEEQGDGIRESAEKAEDAAQDALEYKKAAFMADCGNYPNYCMYQRAESLAGLSGSRNPVYKSVDSWSFSVALKRAQAYYSKRLENEAPADDSVGEQARSAIRRNFYEFAVEEMGRGFVIEDSDSFEAYFPTLPKNTDQMRATRLYTDRIYPVSRNRAGRLVMHAWSGCPTAQEQEDAGTGSVSQMEDSDFQTCPSCGFTASSVGSVASASSSISNGFEYHYLQVAQAAGQYQEAMGKLGPHKREVEEKAGGLLERLKGLADQVAGSRIEVDPPGKFGVVAIVACVDGVSTGSLFPSGFVQGTGSLGARAAISGATLAEDDSSETETVITDLLSGFSRSMGGSGSTPIVMRLWSSLLMAYTDGHDALVGGVQDALDRLPLVGKSGLGAWASRKLEDLIAGVGLEPAQLHSYKPVMVNTSRVMEADSSGFSQAMLSVKAAFARVPASGSPLSAAVEGLGSFATDQAVAAEERLLIASIELLGVDAESMPFSIALPPAVKDTSAEAIGAVFSRLQGLTDSISTTKEWR